MLELIPGWKVNLSQGWEQIIGLEIHKEYFKNLIDLMVQKSEQRVLVPSIDRVFRVFEVTKFEDIKVVIVGQDPYPRMGQANGLAFGVPYGTELPPSLLNIVNELEACLNVPDYDEKTKTVIRPEPILLDKTNMTLEGWAKQGVLLLNSCMTRESGRNSAHKNMGWEIFTNFIILSLRQRTNKPTVYALWGEEAKQKYLLLNAAKGDGMNQSLAMFATHPSPLSFNRGPLMLRFQGCRHFLKINQFLGRNGIKLIDWTKTGA